jgi:enterochelin esterase-like enzyme
LFVQGDQLAATRSSAAGNRGSERTPLVQQVPVEEVPVLFLVCGGQDEGVEQTHALLQVLARRRIPHEYREISPRGHEWRIWNQEIPVFLDKLEKLDGFEPVRGRAAERRNR